METKEISIAKLGGISGICIAAGLIAYFLLMKAAGLAQVVGLRAVNLVIMLSGLMLMYNYYRSHTKDKVNYFPGIGLGSVAIAVSVVLFSGFIFFYFWKLDPGLLEDIRHRNPHTANILTPFTSAFEVACEGIGSGAMLVFSLMQYYKGDFLQRTVNEEGIRA
jgi:hypothetical protein